MYRDNLWISYVINAAELVSFLLWRHTPSAIFSARPPRISMFQRSWTELIAETARNRQLRSPIKPFKFVRTPKKMAQLFRATKSFQKQKNCWTRRGTLRPLLIHKCLQVSLEVQQKKCIETYGISLWRQLIKVKPFLRLPMTIDVHITYPALSADPWNKSSLMKRNS